MTLVSSGQISMGDINTELGFSANAAITLNDAAVRLLAGISSGMIKLSDFYGKGANILYAWGSNLFGELGDGTSLNNGSAAGTKSSPVQIGTNYWKTIAASRFYSLAIRSDGTLWSWGVNSVGQLGLGDTTNRISPVQVGTDSTWVSIASQRAAILAIKSNGTLWAWGSNLYGALGDGTTVGKSSPIQIGTLTDWSTIQMGYYHALAIKSNGTLWAWGNNIAGQLGDGTKIDKSSPIQIGADTNWTKISGNNYISGSSYAVKTNGTLWAWGGNESGQIGDGTLVDKSSPIQIGANTNWTNVYGSFACTHALTTSGQLFAWGFNGYGALGDGTTVGKSSPIQIGTDTNWSVVSYGNIRKFALKTNGTLWAWGENVSWGGLGDGTQINKSSPIQIGASTKWNAVSGGEEHAMALRN